MSRAHARLFFLDSQSKITLLGINILQAQLSDFSTGNSTRNFGKLNWFTLGELQRGQRVETKTANSKPRERIPSFLAGCACVDPICAYVYVHASHLRAESSTLIVHLIFFLEKWENQDLAQSVVGGGNQEHWVDFSRRWADFQGARSFCSFCGCGVLQFGTL